MTKTHFWINGNELDSLLIFQEDNIQGNIYDDEDEDEEELFEEKPKEEEKKEDEIVQTTEDSPAVESTEEPKNDEISKLLEETKVPELPDFPGSSSEKKSVKFSETIAKVSVPYLLNKPNETWHGLIFSGICYDKDGISST